MPTSFCTLCNVPHEDHHKTDCQGRHFRPAGSFKKPKKSKSQSKKKDASAPAPVDRPEPTQATCYNHEQLAARWIEDNADSMCVRPDGTWRIWQSGAGWTAYDPLPEMAALGGSVFHRWTQDGPKPDIRYGGSLSTAQACERLSRQAMQHDAWDADGWLLGLPDGLVADLRTGKVRPVEKGDYVSRSAGGQPVDTWNPESRWGQFVAAAIPQDSLEWFQRAIGYSATGLTTEEILLFLYGSANTGKGTILTAIANALGDYARRIDPDDLMQSRNSQHPAWMADLDGRRLVVADEVKRGARWNTGRTKALVSGEPMRARLMHRNYFEIRPQAQVVMAGNHAPSLQSRDVGMHRRLRVVPFLNRPERPDATLKAEAVRGDWMADVLRWIFDGAARYAVDGLGRAGESMRTATRAYHQHADGGLADFVKTIQERELQPDVSMRYANWARERGIERPLSARNLAATLREDYGFGEWRSHGRSYWLLPLTRVHAPQAPARHPPDTRPDAPKVPVNTGPEPARVHEVHEETRLRDTRPYTHRCEQPPERAPQAPQTPLVDGRQDGGGGVEQGPGGTAIPAGNSRGTPPAVDDDFPDGGLDGAAVNEAAVDSKAEIDLDAVAVLLTGDPSAGDIEAAGEHLAGTRRTTGCEVCGDCRPATVLARVRTGLVLCPKCRANYITMTTTPLDTLMEKALQNARKLMKETQT